MWIERGAAMARQARTPGQKGKKWRQRGVQIFAMPGLFPMLVWTAHFHVHLNLNPLVFSVMYRSNVDRCGVSAQLPRPTPPKTDVEWR
jgi:hypothetical protein